MKKTIISMCLLAGAYMFQGCGNGTSTTNNADSSSMKDTTSAAMAPDTSSAPKMSSTPLSKDDSEFAVKAADGGMEEVAMGQLAQQNAMSQRVKDFGAMMVKDHTAANDKLKTLASSKGLTLPSALSSSKQKDVDKMGKKTGKDFDKDYMNMMLSDHKDDIKDFQKAGAKSQDADLKNFALATLPTLQVHLDSAMAITGKK